MVDDFSNNEVGGEDFPTSTTNNDEQEPGVNELPKVGRMGWINYFKMESKRVDSAGKSKTRAEIGRAYKALSIEEKATYGHMYIDNVASTTHSNKQTQQNTPETQEECGATEIDIAVDDQIMVHTRCTPSRLCRVVDNLNDSQKDAVRALGFGNLLSLKCGRLRRELCGWLVSNFDTKSSSLHIHGKTIRIDSSSFAHVMGIPDNGATIHIHGAVPNLDYWGSKFNISSRGIDVKHIEDRLQVMTTSDDEFKVAFCLFILGTLLAPGTMQYVHAGYLIPLSTVNDICNKNWSSWCFDQLCDGIQKYKLGQTTRYISGCILFLQLFYVHSIQWEPPVVDKALPPIVSWTNFKIKKCLDRLRSEGGVGSNKVVVAELVTKPSHGGKHQVDPPSFVAGQGTPFVMDADVGTSNNATRNTIVSELQLMRAEIGDLKSKLIGRDEFDDLKRKVNEIYEYLRDEDGKEHGRVKKKAHIFEEEGKEHDSTHKNVNTDHVEKDAEHGRLHVMNPKQEGTIDCVDHSHRTPNSPVHPTDNSFKPSPLLFSSLPRPIKPTIHEVSSNDTKPVTKDPVGKSMSNESWLNAPFVNSNVIWHSQDLPIDEHIDDDHGESNDDYDFLNVRVPNFVPSLLDEDIKDEEFEFSSKPSTKKTRTSNQRRPSRALSSPFVFGPYPSKRGKKFKYGPFQISSALSEIDGQIIQYIFSSNLPSSEIILDLPGIQVKRNSFRSLNPKTFIDSEIISAVAEYRTMMMKRSRSPLRWYLTTYFVYTVLGSGNGQPPKLENLIGGFKNTYMYDLRRCEQIYIPINDLKNHWYMALVKVKEQLVEIWDSLPPRRKDDQTRTTQVRSLMHALDIVLSTEISADFPSTFSFSSFTITTFEAPEQENCFDCGLFVCMFMDDNYPSPNQMVTFDSETYRLLLARFLAVLHENNHLKQLQVDAQNHHKELLSKGLLQKEKKRQGGRQRVKN